MGFSKTLSLALRGLEVVQVGIEADVAPGLPAFNLVGLPDASTLQARERVRSAVKHAGFSFPACRVTVNMTPAWIPKQGTRHDLAIAVAILAAADLIPVNYAKDWLYLGELGLDGRCVGVPGILPSLHLAAQAGFKNIVVPRAALAEATLVQGIKAWGINNLKELVNLRDNNQISKPQKFSGSATASSSECFLRAGIDEYEAPGLVPSSSATSLLETTNRTVDFNEVVGQHEAVFAAEVAAAGGHHLMMVGAPGAGKTMIAERIPGLLGELDDHAALEVSAIRSLIGEFNGKQGLIRIPPFEAPHHSASRAAIIGGGSSPVKPGAITRAHHGVLFLDEAPEFASSVLEALREPLETGLIQIHRASEKVMFPAKFLLVLAANPCPCGQAWNPRAHCTCLPHVKRRYLQRLSGPLRDRIDISAVINPVDVTTAQPNESTVQIRTRVLAARKRQLHRYQHHPFQLNAHVPGEVMRREFPLASQAQALLDEALGSGRLSMRGYIRVMRLAWSVADLKAEARPSVESVAMALALRSQGEDNV